MKITKSFLKQIIKEELQGFGQGEPGKDNFSKKRVVHLDEEDQVPASLMQLQKKLIMVAKNLSKLSGLDTNEIKLINALLDRALDVATGGNAATNLKYAVQKLGAGKEEAPAKPEVA